MEHQQMAHAEEKEMIGNSEHVEQVNFFYWAWVNRAKHPALELMFAIPNGGHRHIAVARKLKAEGVKAGVPDIFLPWPVQGSMCPHGSGAHGFFLEMKSDKGKATLEQKEWITKLRNAGYVADVFRGFEEAAEATCNYLGIDPKTTGIYVRK
jgi:hypothetical protein